MIYVLGCILVNFFGNYILIFFPANLFKLTPNNYKTMENLDFLARNFFKRNRCTTYVDLYHNNRKLFADATSIPLLREQWWLSMPTLSTCTRVTWKKFKLHTHTRSSISFITFVAGTVIRPHGIITCCLTVTVVRPIHAFVYIFKGNLE